MKKVYWLNGPIGAGKTTVGQVLASECRLPFAEIDHFAEIFMYKGGKPEDWWRECYKRLAGFVELIDEDILIVAYPVSERQYSMVKQDFEAANINLQIFTLQVPLEKLLSRGNREMSNWERVRQKEMYNEYSDPPFGKKINADRSVEDIVRDLKGAIYGEDASN